jgi:hypothetical protein
MEKAAIDVDVDVSTLAEQSTLPKLSQTANQDDLKTDYSSKAKNKTKFSDYAVRSYRLSLQLSIELMDTSANLYLLYFD